MEINLENTEPNSVRAYDAHFVCIGETEYTQSIVISRDEIIYPWPVHRLDKCDLTNLAPILELKPEVIVLGHPHLGAQLPLPVSEHLSKLRIGIEVMSIGAACRTFNVLLSEQRAVILGLLF